MLRRTFAAALAATGLVHAQKAAPGQNCPKDSPCCGLYMDCGVGAYCVQGCDPVHSHSLEACVPNPQCKSGTYKFDSLNDVQTIDKYLGDDSKINWVSQGKPVLYNDAVLLTMAEGTVGTLLSSAFYVWYGKVCAKMTTSQGQGVVTAFILMSDAKDEIDYEWVGVDVNTAQSNFYFQGITNYNNGKNLPVSNTVSNVHEYCIDWTPDQLKWVIDGDVARTLNKKDTWNETSKNYHYPQTPSRIMLSLWPAGLPSNEEGTIEWAGGEIDWNSKYMQNGYYYAMVKEVTVDCYDPPASAKGNGGKTYIYKDRAAVEGSVELSDKHVILGSLYATGEDPDEGAETATSGSAKPTKAVNVVPGGVIGGGGRGEGVETSALATATDANGQPQQTGGNGGGNGGNGGNNGNNGGGDRAFNQGDDDEGAGSLTKVGGGAIAFAIALLGLVAL